MVKRPTVVVVVVVIAAAEAVGASACSTFGSPSLQSVTLGSTSACSSMDSSSIDRRGGESLHTCILMLGHDVAWNDSVIFTYVEQKAIQSFTLGQSCLQSK